MPGLETTYRCLGKALLQAFRFLLAGALFSGVGERKLNDRHHLSFPVCFTPLEIDWLTPATTPDHAPDRKCVSAARPPGLAGAVRDAALDEFWCRAAREGDKIRAVIGAMMQASPYYSKRVHGSG